MVGCAPILAFDGRGKGVRVTDPHRPIAASQRPGRSDLPAFVADELRNWIAGGKLTPGSKVPTERELGEIYQVSRIVVREAISRLRHEGLVVSQQGKGVFVASPEDSRFLQISEQSLSEPEDFRKLYELRLVLETGAASLAARHRTDEDLAALEKSLEELSQVASLDKTYVASDIGFHRAISAAARNPFLAIMTAFVDTRLRDSIALAIRSLDFHMTVSTTLGEHTAIYECIRRRDETGASDEMRNHLTKASLRFGLSVSP
jgi:GntR family transcriptional repressor for pyruvate dehydrogenase complex